ncbi:MULTISPECIES: ABC transporter substrate-binding protein [unclassified Pseudomonas]|uniref:ABC transporter substrate-binding protein n=1 Tax=unclassified Pseudomonas TaxID=196821 RepID=UPI000BCEFBF7|nr:MULTISPECIES: ABC transporter substrate-binding protein [unclassified Pseudomonas]PVZ20603.1 iron complex transport system substrate-binding protein [Pseudomonas sp. URIL14HWK12:I12]PVZ27669.1 iron complex transport system substrate-binding protein [Pseudomonas sp. URIL14HWK12:I10]PVZ38558.1 iron complex transport system substrate-binding protein [Pseudomonas sp. URIL14HWK12:I11]SNZ02881.1 iron complex transport system substrate-binding protein [Pseudomonas sp. URIL14HWK12:I9]
MPRCASRRLFGALALALLSHGAMAATTVTDIAGRQVQIPDKVDHVLLGEGRMIYAVAALDRANPFQRVVGWQGELKEVDAPGYAAYKAKFPQIDNIPTIGQTSEASVNPERVLDLHPDIAIFGIAGHGPGIKNPVVEQLQQAGVPVLFIDFREHPMQNTVPSMKLLGQALQREKEAQAYIDWYQRHLAKVESVVSQVPPAKRPSVFIELLAGYGKGGVACCHSAGKGNMGEFIEAAGGNNIAAPLIPGPIGDINLEKLITADPRFYLASGTRDEASTDAGLKAGQGVSENASRASLQTLVERPGISSLTAVREGRVHGLWHNYYNSPYNVLAVEAMAKWFYPEQMKDVDPAKSLQELGQFLPVQPQGTYWVDLKP